MTRSLALAALVLATSLGASGCSTPCEELAAKICACEGTRSSIEACERRAAQIQSSRDPTEAGQARCEQFIESCNCHAIGTAPGDRACGLAE